MKLGLYIHIPFCVKKCPYCAFHKTLWSVDAESQYLMALEQEMQFYTNVHGRLTITSLFIGGGTPNSLSLDHFERLLQLCYRYFDIDPKIEKTVELNPEILTTSFLAILKSLHINRLSLGIQSFLSEDLIYLGRQHSPKTAESALQLVRDWGFSNINIDLMFSLKHSSLSSLLHNISVACSFEPTHLSTYALTIEPGTLFQKQIVKPLDQDKELKQYKRIRSLLRKAGYQHYEVSAFAKKGFQSQHNLTYWRFENYIGLGPSAASFF